jgi:polar amino acid transport system substrate-binding protein
MIQLSRHAAAWVVSFVAGVSASCGVAAAAAVADLTAYTENWAPYNFMRDKQVRGIASDLLRLACERAKLDCRIEMVPWARAVHTVKSTPNTVLFTTARKPSREHEYVWVGPILPRTTWVYGRAGSEKNLHTLKDLSTSTIGVVRGEAAQTDLEHAGVPASAFRFEADNTQVLQLVMRDVVTTMVDTEAGMAWNLRASALPANSVTRLMKLSDEGAYYYALHLKSDPVRVRKLQQAIDALRSEGALDAIVRDYGIAPAN